jgi:hypothetical protein
VDKFSIAIEWNSAQDIVVQVLKQDLECLREDWNKRYNDQWGCGGIFTTDKQKTLKKSLHTSQHTRRSLNTME